MTTIVAPHVSDADTRRKDDEIRQLFLKLGIGLPGGWNFDSKNSADVLLTAVKTANLIREKREAKEAAKPAPDVLIGEGVATGPAQFAEGDPSRRTPFRPISAMTPAQARADCASRKSWSRK